jgi:hypothetical protein
MRIAVLAVALVGFPLAQPGRAQPPAKDSPVDRAVERALEFLRTAQNPADGSWRATREADSPAVTSLAVMAFLSAGHVPGEGRYGQAVEKGVRWVLRRQQPNGLIAPNGNHEMYHHGIATLMLAEVAGMTDGELAKEVRQRLEKAVAIILKAQRTRGEHRGGWRYHVAPVDGSDISVTGWQLMALRAAKNLGCDVPAEAIDRAVEYILRCYEPGTGGFRYNTGARRTVPCTGTSILALEICGKDRHHTQEALRAGSFLIQDQNLPRWNGEFFFYSIYYCSQATFQLGGNYWAVYRKRLHDTLLRTQNSDGCWDGHSADGVYGRSYCTAMSILALTVEYRFLPIYQRGEEPADADK